MAQPQQWQRDREELRYRTEIWEVQSTGHGAQWVGAEEGRVWTHAFISTLGTQEGMENIDQDDNVINMKSVGFGIYCVC